MKKPTRRISPDLRKKRELERDHHSSSQHGLRKDWARLKSPEVGIERRAVTLKARKVLAEASDPSSREDLDLHVTVRRGLRPRKDTLASVGAEVSATSTARSTWQVGYGRYFSKSYESGTHRGPFTVFIETIMSGGTPKAGMLAAHYLSCLSDTEPAGVRGNTAAFLRAFGGEEPALFGRFLAWARQISGDPPNPSLQRTRYARR